MSKLKQLTALALSLSLVLGIQGPTQAKKAPQRPKLRLILDDPDECPLSQSEKKFVLTGIHHIALIFGRHLGLPIRNSKPFILKYFCTTEEVQNKFNENSGSAGTSVAGFYKQGTNTLYMTRKLSDEYKKIIILHESTHAFVSDDHHGNYPVWLNEGIAEYFERSVPEYSTMTVYFNLKNEKKEWIKQNNFPTLRLFFKLDYDTSINWKHSRDIAQSLIFYFMSRPGGRVLLRKLIVAARENKDPAKVLDTSYPGGIDRLQIEWERFLRGRKNKHVWRNL